MRMVGMICAVGAWDWLDVAEVEVGGAVVHLAQWLSDAELHPQDGGYPIANNPGRQCRQGDVRHEQRERAIASNSRNARGIDGRGVSSAVVAGR
jgi:hypothetical protein